MPRCLPDITVDLDAKSGVSWRGEVSGRPAKSLPSVALLQSPLQIGSGPIRFYFRGGYCLAELDERRV